MVENYYNDSRIDKKMEGWKWRYHMDSEKLSPLWQ